LEFDRAMGRLSEEDFAEMAGRLRLRAAGLIKQLDSGASYRDQIEKDLVKRLGTAADADVRHKGLRADDRVCAACITVNDHDARVCKSCGEPVAGHAARG